MTNDLNARDVLRFKKILHKEKEHLKSIEDGIIEGVREGVKEGISEGLKAGVDEGLKECLAQGFINIDEGDIQEVIKDISEETIKNIVKDCTEDSIGNGVNRLLHGICNKIIKEIQSQNLELSENQVKVIIELINKLEKEAEERIGSTFQNNFFFNATINGINMAFSESFNRNATECEERIMKEIRTLKE
jgi:flagellar biosynthesis/type III secretory pathway protein FliH